jgi:hypothetical protein
MAGRIAREILFGFCCLVVTAALAAIGILIAAAVAGSGGCTYDSLLAVHYHAANRGEQPPSAGPVEPGTPITTRPGETVPAEDDRPQTATEIIDEILGDTDVNRPAAPQP